VRLGRLTVAVLHAFRDYAAEVVGDPFEAVERFVGRAPDEAVSRMLRDAEDVRDQLRYFSLATPLAQKLLGTESGQARLIRLLMTDKAATEEDAMRVVLHLAGSAIAEAIAKAQGSAGGTADPNARPGAAGPASAGETFTGD
jgi:hypothetical protein